MLKVRDIRKAALGEKHLEFGLSLYELARFYLAREFCQGGATVAGGPGNLLGRGTGENNPYHATSVNNLGFFYLGQGNYAAAGAAPAAGGTSASK